MTKQSEAAFVIEPLGMFSTPSSVEALTEQLNRYSGQERIVALTAMGMTWNLLASLVNEAVAAERSLQNPYANIDPDKE